MNPFQQNTLIYQDSTSRKRSAEQSFLSSNEGNPQKLQKLCIKSDIILPSVKKYFLYWFNLMPINDIPYIHAIDDNGIIVASGHIISNLWNHTHYSLMCEIEPNIIPINCFIQYSANVRYVRE
jgi:hypothetical protein